VKKKLVQKQLLVPNFFLNTQNSSIQTFWFTKIFGPEKFWVKKILYKKRSSLKNFWAKKYLGPIKLWSKKHLGPIFGSTKILVQKI